MFRICIAIAFIFSAALVAEASMSRGSAALKAKMIFGPTAVVAELDDSDTTPITRCVFTSRTGIKVEQICIAGSWETMFAAIPLGQMQVNVNPPLALKFAGHFGCITDAVPLSRTVSTPFGPIHSFSPLLDCEDRLYNSFLRMRLLSPMAIDTEFANAGMWFWIQPTEPEPVIPN